MIDEENKESAVEVTLPDEPITEINLEADTPKIEEPAPRIEKVAEKKEKAPEPKAEPKVDDREKALNDLRRQYEHQKKVAAAEREARQQAEQYARQQAQKVGYAYNEVQDSNLKIILNAIDATEQAAAGAERDYAAAMAAGDFASAARAQRIMAQAESHLLQLQNGKNQLEESLQTQEGSVYAPEVPNFEPHIPQDPVEMYAQRLTPKSAQWLREHPEAVDKIGRLTRAHQDALEDGIQAETPEYFRYIEGRLGIGQRQSDPEPEPHYEEPQRVSEQTPPKKSVASAPVTSSASITSSRSNGNGNTMTLSAAEVEMAILAEPELSRDKAIETYARNKAYLVKQGKLSA